MGESNPRCKSRGWNFDHTLWDELVFAEVDDTSVVQREIAQMFGVSDAERPLLDAEFKNARTLFDVLSSLDVGAHAAFLIRRKEFLT